MNKENSSSKLGSNLGGINIDRKKSGDQLECPKSPGRLIKSPRTGESKFISAGIINKSPQMQKSPKFELDGSNVLDALVTKKKSIGITVSAPLEDFKLSGNDKDNKKFPIRRDVVKFTNLKDSIEYKENVKIDEKVDKETDGNSAETTENNYEGYLYKLTKTKKLKKMYFRLIHKDMYCKFDLK